MSSLSLPLPMKLFLKTKDRRLHPRSKWVFKQHHLHPNRLYLLQLLTLLHLDLLQVLLKLNHLMLVFSQLQIVARFHNLVKIQVRILSLILPLPIQAVITIKDNSSQCLSISSLSLCLRLGSCLHHPNSYQMVRLTHLHSHLRQFLRLNPQIHL